MRSCLTLVVEKLLVIKFKVEIAACDNYNKRKLHDICENGIACVYRK